MNIRIESPNQLFIDDQLAGPVFDSLLNRKIPVAEFQRGLSAYVQKLDAETKAAVDAANTAKADAIAAVQADRDAAVAAALAAKATAEQALADYKAHAEPAIDKARAVIADQTLTEDETYAKLTEIIADVEKPVKQRLLEAAQAELAAAQAKVATLSETPAESEP